MMLRNIKSIETWVMIAFSLLAFVFSLFQFFLSSSPISYTGGAELVVLTTITIAVFTFLTRFFNPWTWQQFILNFLIIIFLLGTLFASFFLESWTVLALLVVVLTSWVVKLFHNNG